MQVKRIWWVVSLKWVEKPLTDFFRWLMLGPWGMNLMLEWRKEDQGLIDAYAKEVEAKDRHREALQALVSIQDSQIAELQRLLGSRI